MYSTLDLQYMYCINRSASGTPPRGAAYARRARACRAPGRRTPAAVRRPGRFTREEYSMVLLERYRAAVERNEFSVFLFWRGLW